jgi:four helix bundle protein
MVEWSKGIRCWKTIGEVIMRIQRFEDLQAWQQARMLANLIYDAVSQGTFSRDFELRDQICAAAGSVMHNSAEGFDTGSDAEFIVFLKYARKAASEVQSEIYLALDRKYVDDAVFKEIYEKATEVRETINLLIAYLRKDKSSRNRFDRLTI